MGNLYEREFRLGGALSVSSTPVVSNTGVLAAAGGLAGMSCVFVVTNFSGGGTKTAGIQVSNDGVNWTTLSVPQNAKSGFTITANGTYEIELYKNETVHRFYRVTYLATSGGFTVTDAVVAFGEN